MRRPTGPAARLEGDPVAGWLGRARDDYLGRGGEDWPRAMPALGAAIARLAAEVEARVGRP